MHGHDQRKQARHISAAEAARLVRSGDWIDYGLTLCQPDVFDKALALQLQLFKWLMIARLLHAFQDQFALHRRIQCSDY